MSRDDEGMFWWLPHLCAAVLGFLVGGYLMARLWRYGPYDEWLLLGSTMSGLVCLMLSLWQGPRFWSEVRRLFGKG
ncbi:hypothetical protein G8A07_20930 [Roseateles sp. DAIF2]|uniref:hypothetical protein n=1 Tax=Roseateles sp. DAIF2 TaxID=2714952 RepID=UPI0018A2E7CD|nr:hypothetical protein [Roseateles sp. DAIF2]QPF75136.1 hypothetical protein G8A07_20930 [Roseateles sp. DAIF2]